MRRNNARGILLRSDMSNKTIALNSWPTLRIAAEILHTAYSIYGHTSVKPINGVISPRQTANVPDNRAPLNSSSNLERCLGRLGSCLITKIDYFMAI